MAIRSISKYWHLERQIKTYNNQSIINMKKIIEKPFNHKVWCDMTFDNDDLANKFVEELNSAGVSCKKNGNKVSISYID